MDENKVGVAHFCPQRSQKGVCSLGSTSVLPVIRELTKPSCYIRRYRKDFGQLVDVKRNKNLLDSQCVGCVYARSAMRGKERSTEPRQA
jgi:hypothetical protein